jgi:hypothetical protein
MGIGKWISVKFFRFVLLRSLPGVAKVWWFEEERL